MVITCPQCRKRYKISRDRAAAVRKPIQCPACKGKIELAKALAAPKPSDVRLLIIECRTCKKIYRIPETKIPAGKTRARCQACGQGIDLTPYLKGKKDAKPSSPVPADHPPAQPPQPTGRSALPAAMTACRVFRPIMGDACGSGGPVFRSREVSAGAKICFCWGLPRARCLRTT